MKELIDIPYNLFGFLLKIGYISPKFIFSIINLLHLFLRTRRGEYLIPLLIKITKYQLDSFKYDEI